MWNDYKDMLAGMFLWTRLKWHHHINYDKVVVFLPEDDLEWNFYALAYLDEYRKRKSAKEAIAFIADVHTYSMAKKLQLNHIELLRYPADNIRLILKYYCFNKFFENVSFFYLDYPRDNKNRLILERSNVTKEELICLAFYCLRRLPNVRYSYPAGGYPDV